MRNKKIVTVIAAVIIGALFGLIYKKYRDKNSVQVSPQELGTTGPLRVGMKFPTFDLLNVSNDQRQPLLDESTNGKIVIINFWASWCAPCVEEFPSLIKLASDYKDDLVVLAISMDSQKEEVDRFLKAYPEMKTVKNFKVLWDKGFKPPESLELDRLPETFVVSKSGVYIKQISGSVDWQSADAVAWLKSILK